MRQLVPSTAPTNLAADKMKIFQRIDGDIRQTLRIMLLPKDGTTRSCGGNERPLEP
jgi:hypothetical protein